MLLEKTGIIALQCLPVMKILFVCYGNTCRSPMAESYLRHKIQENNLNWIVDSAGLSPNSTGKSPNPLGLQVMEENNLTSDHLGRQVSEKDFYEFDYILCMDTDNLAGLKQLESKAIAADSDTKRIVTLQLLGSYIGRPEHRIIHDPYESKNLDVYRSTFRQISEAIDSFIAQYYKDCNPDQ